jgi:hypothetical protein
MFADTLGSADFRDRWGFDPRLTVQCCQGNAGGKVELDSWLDAHRLNDDFFSGIHR